MTHHGTETDFELTTLERLKALKYRHVFGMDLERPHREVVLKDVLRDSLTKCYPDLPPAAIEAGAAGRVHAAGLHCEVPEGGAKSKCGGAV